MSDAAVRIVRPLTSLDDLLTDEEREELRRGLAAIAKARRDGWAKSQGLVIG